MQNPITLEARLREQTGNQVRALRRQGIMPAVLYGHEIQSVNLAVDDKSFEQVYKTAGESTLIDLKIGDQNPVKVLIQDVSKHYLTLKPIHADFYKVSMTDKLTAAIPFKFFGEAPAVKEFGGVLVKNMQEVEVECLPQDLVHEIAVDLAALKALGDAVHIQDIVIPAGIEVQAKPDAIIVLVQEPRAQDEEAPVDEKSAIEQIGRVGAEKAEEAGAENDAGEEKKAEVKKDKKDAK